MTRLALSIPVLALAACVGADRPPEVRRDVPAFLFCTPEGVSPLAATLVGRPLDEARPYADAAGVLVDIAEIQPDGSVLQLAIETTDILTILHRDRVVQSVSCIPRDLCTGELRGFSQLCR
ncbi:hypothetical protein [Roseicyclus persicicus]|uniref:Lipoprotein n=1 Tax=Roseicyclus persicicus TaxID=2650661 RepID=A0A7X6H0L1_9RHOB|nr:hypothetical protein [Roseibacterium persicicum]NKX45831.1 hypothetical protein [Roseibacterium persicicum]